MLRNRVLALVTSHIKPVHITRHPIYTLVRPNPIHRFSRGYVKICGPVFSDKSIPPCPPPPCPPPPCGQENFRDCKATNVRPTTPPACEPKECPPPDCAWDPSHNDNEKQRIRRFVLGTILATGALYLLWKFVPWNQTKQPPPPSLTKKEKHERCKEKFPAKSDLIPEEIPYLLIGGGTASFAAFRSIKALDPTAKILMITNECDFPYMRPPLSKEIWFNDDEKTRKLMFRQIGGSERSLLYEPVDFYVPVEEILKAESGGLAVARGWAVSKIDPYKRIAILEDGHTIKYDKCLVATGASPKSLDIFEAATPEIESKLILYRGIDDFLQLYESLDEIDSVAVVGGSFLGSELACSLARRAKQNQSNLKVYQIYKEPGNMHKVLPEYLSKWTTKKVMSEGVNVFASTEVEDVKLLPKDSVKLILSNGKDIRVNRVIVAVGVEPNTQLAETSGLEVEPECGGFLVNAELEARSNLYAAGDCSCYYDVKLGRRRVEHHDHAVNSGRLAGENMTGAGKPYLHQSIFWSDISPEVGFEAIGIVDSRLPTVGVFAKASSNDSARGAGDGVRPEAQATATPSLVSHDNDQPPQQEQQQQQAEDYGKGIIFYLRDEMVVGMVLWNAFNRMSIARQVLLDDRKYDDLNEVAKLFNIHDDDVFE